MARSETGPRDREWRAYYERFPYFSVEAVRDGCQPRVYEHDSPSEKAIVLVHGLTDSPHFMTAIGEHFFDVLGYDVYMPLLHFHGLKEPRGMEGVDLAKWKENVSFAVDQAAMGRDVVSIGGLSTGGALSFYTADRDPRARGGLYLFSAALDIAGPVAGRGGNLVERLLRSWVADWFDKDNPLIGANPYRYCRMDLDGARELCELIDEVDAIIEAADEKEPLSLRVFAAHSEDDTTADIGGIEALERVCRPDRFTFHRIPRSEGVSHASLVLRDPVHDPHAAPGGPPLEESNPLFAAMMEEITKFEQGGLG